MLQLRGEHNSQKKITKVPSNKIKPITLNLPFA